MGRSTKVARGALRLQDVTVNSHRRAAANRVADALLRSPLSGQKQIGDLSNKALLAAFVGEAQKCQPCLGPAGKAMRYYLRPSILLQRCAIDTVQMESQSLDKESREMLKPATNFNGECQRLCEETVAPRKYSEKVPGAELLDCAVTAGLKVELRKRYLDSILRKMLESCQTEFLYL